MKKTLLLVLPLLTLFGATAHAARPVSQSVFLRSLAAPSACATTLPAPISDPLIPAPQKRTGGCLQADCFDNSDCPCETGTGFCGLDGTCHYPPPGGGTGGGSLGCPMADCIYDSQCLANCPAGLHSYCGPGGTCVYLP